jgi:hypothetical protein
MNYIFFYYFGSILKFFILYTVHTLRGSNQFSESQIEINSLFALFYPIFKKMGEVLSEIHTSYVISMHQCIFYKSTKGDIVTLNIYLICRFVKQP